MRRFVPLIWLCLAVSACGGGLGVDIAPLPSSAVNPGGDEPYCPSGQAPPCN
jgi:hypothetical protein